MRTPPLSILVTGISGYVGSRLAPRLQRDGHRVRGLARRHLDANHGLEIVTGDVVTGRGLTRALEGVDVAYYLIHSMETAAHGAFSAQEQHAAENFARAAREQGVGRIVYLGGLIPEGHPASPHLASRLAVENILMRASPCSVTFRASIVIGARSRSFRFMVRLVERLPVMALPGWHVHRTAPIDERDIIEMLARAASNDDVCGQSFDVGSRDVVSYGELIDRIRHHMLVARPTISFCHLTVSPIASRVAAVIASEDHGLIGPLMESLESDLVPRDNRAAELLGVRLHSLDAAIERSLRDWEANEPLAAR